MYPVHYHFINIFIKFIDLMRIWFLDKDAAGTYYALTGLFAEVFCNVWAEEIFWILYICNDRCFAFDGVSVWKRCGKCGTSKAVFTTTGKKKFHSVLRLIFLAG